MPLNLPSSASEIDQKMKTDVQRSLSASNPFLKNSWLGALITSIANRIYDFFIQLLALLREVFWDTSTGDFLRRQASWFGFTQNPSTRSSGNVVATGTVGAEIDTDSLYKSSDGIEYEVLALSEIENHVIDILSITRSGNISTVTTDGPHGMASNVTPTISGAAQSEYNLSDIVISVTGLDTFTYEVSGTPVTPATGTIQLSADYAVVPVRSSDFQDDDVDVNQLPDASLTLQSPLVGVDNSASVDFSGIGGGTEVESEPEFRDRFISGVQNPTALFNVQAITDQCKKVPGVTRVFVKEITPDIGQVTVYFVRDNDDDIIPSPGEVTTVKNKLLEIKPATTAEADVIVSAPSANVINFTFTALSPDTPSMREAVDANIDQFFKENTNVGVNIDEDAYRAAIFSTVDPKTGDSITNFDLSSPTGDIVNDSDEIATRGIIDYVIV